jgi:hypothetical protein
VVDALPVVGWTHRSDGGSLLRWAGPGPLRPRGGRRAVPALSGRRRSRHRMVDKENPSRGSCFRVVRALRRGKARDPRSVACNGCRRHGGPRWHGSDQFSGEPVGPRWRRGRGSPAQMVPRQKCRSEGTQSLGERTRRRSAGEARIARRRNEPLPGRIERAAARLFAAENGARMVLATRGEDGSKCVAAGRRLGRFPQGSDGRRRVLTSRLRADAQFGPKCTSRPVLVFLIAVRDGSWAKLGGH